jgi:hypothetical protein
MGFSLTKEYLHSETEKVLDAILQPQFVYALQTFRSTSGENRLQYARSHLTPGALRDAGLSIPDTLRVSARTFEYEDGPAGYVDDEQGLMLVDALRVSRPDLLENLRDNHPVLFEDLRRYAAPDNPRFPDRIFPPPYDPGQPWDPEGSPLDPFRDGGPVLPLPPRRPPWLPGDPGNPIDPVAIWGCACGGAATACAGAGGGSD